jgi:hypothetical protein
MCDAGSLPATDGIPPVRRSQRAIRRTDIPLYDGKPPNCLRRLAAPRMSSQLMHAVSGSPSASTAMVPSPWVEAHTVVTARRCSGWQRPRSATTSASAFHH